MDVGRGRLKLVRRAPDQGQWSAAFSRTFGPDRFQFQRRVVTVPQATGVVRAVLCRALVRSNSIRLKLTQKNEMVGRGDVVLMRAKRIATDSPPLAQILYWVAS